MRNTEISMLVQIDEQGHASNNAAVVELVMSAVQNVVDTTSSVFSLGKKRHAELFRASLIDLLSTREAQANAALTKWFAARGVSA